MTEIVSFDEAVDRSWNTFQHRLADHLAAMRNDDILVLDWIEETTVDGFTPWIQFLVWDGEYVRAEVSSNAYLAPRYALTPAAENRLCELGWNRPTRLPDEDPDDGSPAFFVDQEQRWADRLAAVAITTLREIWNVPHPSFLLPEHVGSLAGAVLVETAAREPEPAGVDETAVFEAQDPEELRELVAHAVEQIVGFAPTRDADGDVILDLDGLPVFVVTHPEEPLVRVWIPLLEGVDGHTGLAANIGDLTERWPGIQFLLDGDRLDAAVDVSGNPFVPRHLAEALDRLGRFAPTVDDRFAARFGAARPVEHPYDDPDPDAVDDADIDAEAADPPAALLALLHRERGAGAASADEIAAVCGHDRDVVLRYLRIAQVQEANWIDSADAARTDGDVEDTEACAAEASAWTRLHGSLLSALRTIALPGPIE